MLFAAALAVLTCAPAMCQEQQSVSKQINQIKRNNAYIYNEATAEDETEAYQLAYEQLLLQVQELIKSNPNLSNANNVLVKDIQSKVESLSMMRGKMHRVFVYVKKSAIEGVDNTTVINNSSGTTITIADAPASIVDVQPAVPVNATPPAVVAPPQVPAAPPAATPTPTPAVQPSPRPSTTPATRPAVGSTGLSGWQQDAITALVECTDVAAVRAKLNRLKAEYKVKRYGTPDKCPSETEAWWIIFDDQGGLVAVLGPDNGQRIDYRTMKPASLATYKGMNALWFNLAK